MELKIEKAHAELKNVNLRTENNGDERVLASDLKLKIDCTAKSIAPLFADSPGFLDTLYDEGGNVLLSNVQLSHRVQVENVELSVDDAIKWDGGRIKKNATFLPRNGRRMEAVFTIQFSDVRDIRPLIDRLHDEVNVTIIEQQQELDLSDAA